VSAPYTHATGSCHWGASCTDEPLPPDRFNSIKRLTSAHSRTTHTLSRLASVTAKVTKGWDGLPPRNKLTSQPNARVGKDVSGGTPVASEVTGAVPGGCVVEVTCERSGGAVGVGGGSEADGGMPTPGFMGLTGPNVGVAASCPGPGLLGAVGRAVVGDRVPEELEPLEDDPFGSASAFAALLPPTGPPGPSGPTSVGTTDAASVALSPLPAFRSSDAELAVDDGCPLLRR
jgi:hypothetical protein